MSIKKDDRMIYHGDIKAIADAIEHEMLSLLELRREKQPNWHPSFTPSELGNFRFSVHNKVVRKIDYKDLSKEDKENHLDMIWRMVSHNIKVLEDRRAIEPKTEFDPNRYW